MKLLLAIALLTACGPELEPTPTYTVRVMCWEGCARLVRVDTADVRTGTYLEPLCDYLWREVVGAAEFPKTFPAVEGRCSMPQGQLADLEYFLKEDGSPVPFSINLVEPFLPGSR